MQQTRIVINCPLCNQKTLDVMKQDDKEIMQCFGCGYSTNSDMPDTLENATEMNDQLKSHAKEKNNKVWIPSMFQLDWGMIYPVADTNSLMWGFSEMIDIPSEEQKNYPDGRGGYYTKRYDNENETRFKDFETVLQWVKKENEKKLEELESQKNQGPKKVELNLPKIDKTNG